MKSVVICPPIIEYFKVSDRNLHNITQTADLNKALKQHENLRSTITGSGCEVISISELPGHPNSVFTRDTSLVTPEGYVKLKMGLVS